HGLTRQGDEGRPKGEGGETLDSARALRQVAVGGSGEWPSPKRSGMRRRPMNGNQACGLAKWKRLEERATDRARDGGGGSDAEGETEHARDGDGRGTQEPAGGGAKVGEHERKSDLFGGLDRCLPQSVGLLGR